LFLSFLLTLRQRQLPFIVLAAAGCHCALLIAARSNYSAFRDSHLLPAPIIRFERYRTTQHTHHGFRVARTDPHPDRTSLRPSRWPPSNNLVPRHLRPLVIRRPDLVHRLRDIQSVPEEGRSESEKSDRPCPILEEVEQKIARANWATPRISAPGILQIIPTTSSPYTHFRYTYSTSPSHTLLPIWGKSDDLLEREGHGRARFCAGRLVLLFFERAFSVIPMNCGPKGRQFHYQIINLFDLSVHIL
jgi:hypothetical protein